MPETEDTSFPPSSLSFGTVHGQDRSRNDIRLVGGTNEYEGRVEVFIKGRWGTVCDDGWDLKDANVACRQLGLGQASIPQLAGQIFGAGTGDILLDDLECTGNEASLVSCQHAGVGTNNCNHREDAGVVCSPEGTKQIDCLQIQ